jgi:proteasome lid subunit RPN8/RPN11
MKVILPKEIVEMLINELKKAGTREIGGILMGEHLGDKEFKVCDITIQRLGGGFAFFERTIQNVIAPLKMFFDRTGRNYKRFNYLGEWHSHPSFEPRPSTVDHNTMTDLVNNAEFKGNFAVLLIIKLCSEKNGLEGSVTIFSPNMFPCSGNLIFGSE